VGLALARVLHVGLALARVLHVGLALAREAAGAGRRAPRSGQSSSPLEAAGRRIPALAVSTRSCSLP